MTSRWCSGCEKNRNLKFWASSGSRSCLTCQKRARSEAAHRSRVRRTYGLTPEGYARLLAYQGGVCAGCGAKRSYRLNVDHDHKTGLVRGLLCRRCNKVLRDVRDSVGILIALRWYLDYPPAPGLGIRASASPEPEQP